MKKVRSVASVTILIMLASVVSITALAQGTRPYRYNNRYMQRLIGRIETRTDHFSNSVSNSLDRSRLNGTRREDDINSLVTDFEHSTDQLKKRFENYQSTTEDARTVLQSAALLDTFMRNHQLDYRAQRDWRLLKGDLDQLASAYKVAWNWDGNIQSPTPTNGPVVSAYDARLTGTYRLNAAQSDNPRAVAERVTRNLDYNERQSVYDTLMARLTSPDMIAIERRGNNVTLASTRSPQVTIDVDGREHIESYPNNRTSRVIARFYGDQLAVSSQGDRPNDFTVSFDPVNYGRRLHVVRRLYAGRLNQTVVVQSYYDRVSDTAQLNLYNINPVYPTTGTANGDFIVPNNTQLVAVLNNNLTTAQAREGDRFTMTVRQPSQYNGATIEGYVSNVNRAGRIAGRAEMTLNFERIRLADGRTYRFAGLIDSVRTVNGENARVDNEGSVQEGNSQTNRTVERTAIGSAIGAVIGAITGGGQGAAIGAAVGAGAGAGSVYVQGRDSLELMSGTEVTIRASAPAQARIQ